jgi:hypothetical protein
MVTALPGEPDEEEMLTAGAASAGEAAVNENPIIARIAEKISILYPGACFSRTLFSISFEWDDIRISPLPLIFVSYIITLDEPFG